MKFLLDENIHRGLFYFLDKLKYDIKLCPKGIKNGDVFKLAREEERVFISQDNDFLDLKYTSSNHFGIILFKISSTNIEIQKEMILKLLKKYSTNEQLKGKVILLKPDRTIEFL